jgi:tetratricopeptide (TPR) repeat protein
MKRNILFISTLFLFALSVFSQSTTVKQANELYIKGQFQEAAKIYETVIANEGVAPELYYNLGNSYYKSDEIGRSILNYERALRLSSTYDDARFNLEMAQLRVVDNIVQVPSFFIGRWIVNLIKLLTSNQWVAISIFTFIFSLISVFVFIFGTTKQNRKTFFYAGSVLILTCIVTMIFAGVRKDQLMNHDEAIVMSGVVVVKSSPDKSGTDLFQLHEGTKVNIKSSLGEWTEIKVGNKNVGWVEERSIEKI